MEGKNLFRKESLEKIESPEQLNDYLKVTTPRIWIGLVAAIVLVVGLLGFVCLGTLESTIPGTATVKDNTVRVTVERWRTVPKQSDIRIRISDHELIPTGFEDVKDTHAVLLANTDLPDGQYDATVLMEIIPAFSFLDQD